MANGNPATAPGRSESGQPTPEQVRLQLERILSSKPFVQSQRLCRFLRITVERMLAGEADQIKEYMLGRDVFDRDHTYDPRVDSIVRVEARRLRVKLRQYYQEFGSEDPVLISFRKGSYAPVFRYLKANHGAHAPAAPKLDPHTVAVLPFLNLSPDPDQEFFCDGMTEEILNALTTIPELKVVARTSVFHFKGRDVDVRQIGEALGAGTVIEGSVRKAENLLRVSAKAIDAVKGVALWSGVFDREFKEIFAVQDEIARAIASALSATLAPASDRGAPRAEVNLEAYTLYLRGRYYWHLMSQDGIRSAIEQFERAVKLFPDYAPGYAGLADAYTHLTFWGAIHPREGTVKAKVAALDALRLNDRLAEPRAQLGAIVSCFEWLWQEGEQYLKGAIALQPSNVVAYHFLAFVHLCHARFEEAFVLIEKCLSLDPLSPRVSRAKGWAFYLQHDYDRAIESLKLALDLDHRNTEARFLLGCAHLRQGLVDQALAEFQDLPEGPFAATKWGAVGEALGAAGREQEARAAIQKLDDLREQGYVSPVSRLSIHAGLGEWDRVFALLEEAYAEHCPGICVLKCDPRYDPVRSDPRMQSLLQRMGLMEKSAQNR